MAAEPTTMRGAAPELRANAQRGRLAATLETFLADTFSLYTETLGAHWTVTGREVTPPAALTAASMQRKPLGASSRGRWTRSPSASGPSASARPPR